MKSHEVAEVLVVCGHVLRRKIKTDGVLSMDLREGWHSGRESAGVLLLLYSRSRNSEVLHRLQ